MGANDLWAQWRERSLTVRALLVLYAVSFSIGILFFRSTLLAAIVAAAIGILLLWGFWVGKRAVFLLAFVLEATSLTFRVATESRAWWSIASSTAALVLLLAPPTRRWVGDRTWERTEAARRRRAAAPA